MNRIAQSHIRRWLLLCLTMVSITAIVIFALVYLEISATIAHVLANHRATIDPADIDAIKSSLAPLGFRLIILFGGSIAVLLLTGYLWIRMAARRIERPLHTIERALGQLARGQLNETVVIDTHDEFGRIGTGINEVAVNLQELLLYIWKQTGQCLTLLDQIHNNPELAKDRKLTLESLGYLKQLSEAIDDLRDMAKAYVFYDVSIDGNRTQAINEPGESDDTRN